VPVQFRHLERLTAALADAVSLDDTARIVLTELLEVDGVHRVGLALSEGAGRELRFVSSDDDALGSHWIRWCTIDGLADVPLVHTARTGEPAYFSEGELGTAYPELAARHHESGTRSLATVPLLVDDACLGGLLVCWREPQAHTGHQRGFLSAFAAQSAQAVRRAMAYHVQRSVSEELQRSLMPHSLPDVDGLDFGAHYRPGGAHVDVGGDWYDVMPLADGSVVVALGDVMGKGVQAAVVMSELRTATRAYALLDPDPSTVLERLDRLVGAGSEQSEQVVTMVYGVIDPTRTELRLAVAGHPPPLVVPASGDPVLLESPLGPALGLAAGPWPSTTVPIGRGSGVLLYSDGLVETRQRDLVTGIDTLRDAVHKIEGRRRNARELCARLTEVLVDDDAGDDVTLLALTAAGPRRTAERTFSGDRVAAGQARRFAAAVLAGWGVPDEVVEEATMCVSELVTNAIIHAGSDTTLTVRYDGTHVLLLVQDRGSHKRVQVQDGEPDHVSGRGLSLVEALSSAWDVEQSTDGTLVWCELELSSDQVAPVDLDLRGDVAS
jgi:anti-sigma regulatory factor (Ser/Thr protein kinase)